MNDKFKNNIKIIFEYNNRKFTSEIAPYEKISVLEPLSKRLIFNLKKEEKPKQEISLTYHNQDLSLLNHLLIGDYFNKNSIITIQIVPKIKKKERRILSDKIVDFNDPIMISLSCICGKFLINNYCREDKIFLCNNCRSKTHKGHKYVKINVNNLNESVINYGTTIQNEIKSNLNDSKKYFEKYTYQNIDDISSKSETIIQKYEKLNNIYNSITEKLMYKEIDKNQLNELLKETKNEHYEIYYIIDEINTNSNKSNYKMSIDEFKKYFDDLNEKDKKVTNIAIRAKIFRVKYELNEKINQINNQIESILDSSLNAKNPLGISDEAMNLYKSILSNENNNDENNNYVDMENDEDD